MEVRGKCLFRPRRSNTTLTVVRRCLIHNSHHVSIQRLPPGNEEARVTVGTGTEVQSVAKCSIFRFHSLLQQPHFSPAPAASRHRAHTRSNFSGSRSVSMTRARSGSPWRHSPPSWPTHATVPGRREGDTRINHTSLNPEGDTQSGKQPAARSSGGLTNLTCGRERRAVAE